MHIRLLLFVSFFIFFISCEENALFEVPDGQSKLFAFSEINEDEKIMVKVHTSIGVNTDDSFTYPKQSDAIVTLYENGVIMDNPGFRYISSKQAFVSQGSFRPSLGVEYGLEVKLKDESSPIKAIYASTIIPEPIGEPEIIKIESGLDENYFYGSVNISLEQIDSKYLIIKPKIKVQEHENLEILKNISLNEGREGSKIICLGEAILVQRTKLRDNKLSFDFGYYFENTDSTYPDSLYLEVEHITKDAYHYYSSTDKMLRSSTQVLSEPVISYSNFEGGLGLFTGFSKKTTSKKF